MTRRTATTLTALALAAALTGCTSDGGDDPTVVESSPSASTGAAAEGEFATTTDLAAALNTGGLTCTELRDGQFPGVSQAQSCILNESEDVVLLKFASDAEKQDYLAHREELASAVVGEDWAVQTVLVESAQAVSEVLGGEVVTGPPASG